MKSALIAALTLLVVASAATAQAETTGYQVVIRTDDGNEVRGAVTLTRIKLDGSLGKLDIDLEKVSVINVEHGRATVRLRDGSSFTGTMDVASWKVKSSVADFDIGTEKIRSIAIGAALRGDAQDPQTPPKPVPGQPPGTGRPTEPALKALARLEMGVSAGRGSRLAQDGAAIDFLAVQNNRLMRIETAGLTIAGSVVIPGNSDVISMCPSGARAFAAARTSISIVDLREYKVLHTFLIERPVADLIALDDDTALATFQGMPDAGLISASKQALVGTIRGPSSLLGTDAGRHRAYSRNGAILLPPAGKLPAIEDLRWIPRHKPDVAGPLVFTADRRFALSTDGVVLRTGRSRIAEMTPIGRVDAFVAAALLPKSGRAMLFTKEGFIKIWDPLKSELLKSVQLGLYATMAFADEDRKALFVFGFLSGPSTYGRDPSNPGDWYKFELPE